MRFKETLKTLTNQIAEIQPFKYQRHCECKKIDRSQDKIDYVRVCRIVHHLLITVHKQQLINSNLQGMADTQRKLGLSQYRMTKLMAAMKITLF